MSSKPGTTCQHCAITPAFRREVCRSCYRKLDDAGLLDMYPRQGAPGQRARRMREWVEQMPPSMRDELRQALAETEARAA